MAHRSPAFRLVLGILFLAALVALPLSAQMAPPASRLLQLTVVTIKPGMTQAYIDYQKSDVIPALQKGGQTWRESWRTAIFGDTFEVAHVSEIKSFEQYDSPSPVRKALGEAGYAAHLAKISPMISSQRTYAIRTRPDLGYVADGSAPMKMAILTLVDVQAPKLAEFEAFLKASGSPRSEGGGKFDAVSQVVYGGSTTHSQTWLAWIELRRSRKGTSRDTGACEDGVVKLMTRSGKFTEHIERRIIRLDPDLSFEVKTTAEAR